jgi:hypothetical protein
MRSWAELRSGLPGNGARRSETAATEDGHDPGVDPGARPGGPGQLQRAEARQAKIAGCDVLPTHSRQAWRAGSTPAGGGPPGKNRRMRCFAYTQSPGLEGRVDSSGRRPARQKSQDAMFCLKLAGPGQLQRAEARQAKIAGCDVLPEASRAGSTPAGGGPPGKNRRMRCFA